MSKYIPLVPSVQVDRSIVFFPTLIYSKKKVLGHRKLWRDRPGHRKLWSDRHSHREICRDRPGYWEICTLLALGRPIRRNVAEDIPRTRDLIKIDLKFDLRIDLMIDNELMTENSALLLYTFIILYPFHVLQFVLLLLSYEQTFDRSIAILYNSITTLCGNFYHTVW